MKLFFLRSFAVLLLVVSATACDLKTAQQNNGAQEQALLPATQSSPFHSVDITGVPYAQGFSMADVHGKVRTLDEFKGKVVVVFFGFAQCPDVCPTTLLELSAVRKKLNALNAGDGDKVQGVFVTVDPDRDTDSVLQAYMQAFDDSFIALRGDAAQTRKLADAFKVFYQQVPGAVEGAYTIEHTAASYVFDTKGKIRLFTRYQMGADKWAEDIQLLLKGS